MMLMLMLMIMMVMMMTKTWMIFDQMQSESLRVIHIDLI